ncbi:MAG: type II CAAX endopeptidase family protein [Candidatus Acidiferrales bacterium]
MTPAERTRTINSILVYLILTLVSSAIFYRLIIRQTVTDAHGTWFVFGLMWCPGISGLLTRLIFQGNWRGHGFGWGKTKYQFVSYWIPLAYASAVYFPVWIAGYADFHSRPLTNLAHRVPNLPHAAVLPLFFLILATVGVFFSCISALGEELGWRGFLVPQLSKIMPFRSVALTSGIIWSMWHYPIILFSDYHGTGPLWYSLATFTVMVVGISFLFAWMRLKSGSVWTGMLLHGSHNLFVQAFFDPQTRHARFTDLWTTEFGAGLALAAMVIAIIFYRKRAELPAESESAVVSST